jgi:hypothetical protein
VVGVQIPLTSIFVGMCINMLEEKHQKLGVGTISNHIDFAITNEVRDSFL